MFCRKTEASYAFVSTNSICQGQNISNFWQEMDKLEATINFAVLSFKWSNLAQNNAGVTVAIIGGGQNLKPPFYIYVESEKKSVSMINAYLVEGKNVWIERRSNSISELDEMLKGNYYGLSDGLLMSTSEKAVLEESGLAQGNIKTFKGSEELTKGKLRYCMWFPDISDYRKYTNNLLISGRVKSVQEKRVASRDPMAKKMAETPHQFREMRVCKSHSIATPVVSSENREYLPVTLEPNNVVFSNAAFALYDASLWNMALIASRIHLVWISTVCGKLKTDFRYSNTMGWNTFPIPNLTEKNTEDLTRCAENILLAREAHFPATIADLYSPEKMPENLRHAHERNDEVLERIYIGRRFKNDTERLEKLFDLYAEMTSKTNKKVILKMTDHKSIPSVSVKYACNGSSTKSNELGMRVMQERAYEKRGEQYLLIKSPPASGKSRALMFITLDKLHNQNVKKAIIIVPEKSIGASFDNEPLEPSMAFIGTGKSPQNGICATHPGRMAARSNP